MWDGAPVRIRQEELSTIRSIIDTNAAYQIAKQGLVAIDVDVERLEREHPVSVKQRSFHATDRGQFQSVLLPLFDVKWGDWNKPERHSCHKRHSELTTRWRLFFFAFILLFLATLPGPSLENGEIKRKELATARRHWLVTGTCHPILKVLI
jgi:hypothetical protein